ncbi:hypothetical protein VTO42DRAFT_6001 [Malbranchea cinnamomea]
MYEIDQLIEQKQLNPKDEEQEIMEAVENILPKPYDLNIERTRPNSLTFSPLYKQSLEELEATKRYLVENLEKDFIALSQAPYAAPVLFVAKPNGSLRFCIDFRRLNAITKKDCYPLPLIDETLQRVSQAKIFTKIDIRQAFYRIRIHPNSEDLTTFRTRYGTYKYKVVPFGLTDGPAVFQRYMNDLFLDSLDNFVTVYLDDILIHSQNEIEHQAHVKYVLKKLGEASLQADIKKSEFHVTRTKYLGFIVGTEGIEVDPEKAEVVKNWNAPSIEYSRIARPRTNLTKKDVPFLFNEACWDAFQTLKSHLLSAPLLKHYQPDLETRLETDASDGVITAVLLQKHGDNWHPVAYFSKTMAPAETHYPIPDKEMLAIANWAETLAQFKLLIKYRPGRVNRLADALSRREGMVKAQQAIRDEFRQQVLLPKECLDPKIVEELEQNQEVDLMMVDGDLDNISKLILHNKEHESLQLERDLAAEGFR